MSAHLENTPRSSARALMHSPVILPRLTPSHLSRASSLCSASLPSLLLGNLPPYAQKLMLDHAYDSMHADTHRPQTRPGLLTVSGGSILCANSVWHVVPVARNVSSSFREVLRLCLDHDVVAHLDRLRCRHASPTWVLLGAGWFSILRRSCARSGDVFRRCGRVASGDVGVEEMGRRT